jgi:hypothetical protein
MKEEKLIKYLFSSKKKINQTIDDKQKYDTRLLALLSSDKVIYLLFYSTKNEI